MAKNNQIRSYYDNTFRLQNNLYKYNCWDKKDVLRDLVYKFCSNAFSNINEFPYVYFTSGVTEALNFLIPKRKFYIKRNEYRYLELFPSITFDKSKSEIEFLSYPFSGNGKFTEVPNDGPVVLDCSYIFASNLKHDKILPNKVEQVMFGLSKSHNLADYRIGWFFSKIKVPEFHILQYDHDYGINNVNYEILLKINSVECNYLYLKYKDQLSELYHKNSINENDTNLFGIKNNQRIPWYHLID